MIEFMKSNYYDPYVAQYINPKKEYKVKLKDADKDFIFDESEADLNKAVFCGTTMPDQTKNNSGCAERESLLFYITGLKRELESEDSDRQLYALERLYQLKPSELIVESTSHDFVI